MTVFWVALLKPFVSILVMVAIVLPITLAVKKWLPEGKLKRLLFTRLGRE